MPCCFVCAPRSRGGIRPIFGPLLLILLVLAGLSGCAQPLQNGRYAADPRSMEVLARDKALTTEILGRFADNEQVGINALTASVYNNRVFLVGEYINREQLDAAREIIDNVQGVQGVTVFALPRAERAACSDARNRALAKEVFARLVADPGVHGYNVEVKTLQCDTVLLLGLLSSPKEIQRAKVVAAGVRGVQQVVSYLSVSTPQP